MFALGRGARKHTGFAYKNAIGKLRTVHTAQLYLEIFYMVVVTVES